MIIMQQNQEAPKPQVSEQAVEELIIIFKNELDATTISNFNYSKKVICCSKSDGR